MLQPEPFNQFLDELNKLLEQLQSVKKPAQGIPIEVEARLIALEKWMENVKKASDTSWGLLGVTDETLQNAINSLGRLRGSDKRLFEKTKKLENEIETARHNVGIARKAAQQKEREQGKAGKKSQTRKKRFERLGSKKDWKPL